MTTELTNLLDLWDKGIDSHLVATLAGLALASVTFYAPLANQLIKENSQKILNLEAKVSTAVSRGYDYGVDDLEDEIHDFSKSISATKNAQGSLVKAFVLLALLTAYSIIIDPIIAVDAIKGDKFEFDNLGVWFDVSISISVLTIAGIMMYRGVDGIRNYFNIEFEDERNQMKQINENLRNLINKNRTKF